eukprot:35718_1
MAFTTSDTYKPTPGNTLYLTSGYLRECNIKKKTLPSTLINMVQHYYSKFNGKTYRWQITDQQTIQQLLKKSDTFCQKIDSDAFDIGLPNKCFLQLTRENITKSTWTSKSSNNNNNNNNSSWGSTTFGSATNNNNNNNSSSGSVNMNVGSTNMNTTKKDVLQRIPIYLKLLSLPLSSQYDYILCHYELYNIETRSEYNGIWRLSSSNNNNFNNNKRYARKHYDKYDDWNEYSNTNYSETSWD